MHINLLSRVWSVVGAQRKMAASNEEDEVISERLTQQVEDLSINSDDATCANCGKEGSNLQYLQQV